MSTLFQADAAFIGGTLVTDAQLVVSDQDGRVLPPGTPTTSTVSLKGKLLLPGFINGHSHAFQRAIRGRTEFLAPGHERDDFWTWREAMYAAAEALDPEQLYAVSKQAFLEMALAGITTVGEFHYVQHQADGTPYEDSSLLAQQVIRAARDVGLRIVLLRVGYERAGFQVPPNPRQRRFLDAGPDAFLRAVDSLRSSVNDPLVRVGVAPHSVRAVSREWLRVVGEALRAQPATPVHMHVAEQPAEIRASLAEHGKRPVELLADLGLLDARFTAVHAIHLEANEVELLGRARATVCACPSTERNLGDGIVRVDELLAAGASVSLGSDSQAHIDLLAEAQMLEGHLRLLRQRRNVLAPSLGERLLDALTPAGARSLGMPDEVSLLPGSLGDFVAVDLQHPSIVGRGPLLERVVLGAAASAITDVFVAGMPIVRDGRHAAQEDTSRRFSEVMTTLTS